MLVTTQGLVLHTTKYSETSVVAKIFTREMGVRSYIIKGVRSAKSKTKQNLLQPLSHLELTVYDGKADLNYIKEMHVAQHYPELMSNPVKVTILFFMNEVLYKCLREQDFQPEVFDYVAKQLEVLELNKIVLKMQPLMFLLRMSTFLGIEPMNNYSLKESLFNLREGCFVSMPSMFTPNPEYLLSEEESLLMHYLLAAYHGAETPLLDNRIALRTLITYYQTHMVEFKNFKSYEILHTILS